MDYDTRSATFYRNKVSLATVEGRVESSFVFPADSPTPYERYGLSENYEFRESTLRYDAATDEFYLNISTRRTDSDDEVSEDIGHPDQTVLGIDLGVNSLAVSSTGTFWQETTTTIGVVNSRSDVVRCNSAGHKPHTTPCFASGSVKKPGVNSTSTRSPTNSFRKPSNTTAM